MSYSLTHSSDELKKLILENPDLPIVVLAGEEASGYDFYWTYCSSVSCHISEILDCDYYDYLKNGKPDFMGEYMSQYSWAEGTCGMLWQKNKPS